MRVRKSRGRDRRALTRRGLLLVAATYAGGGFLALLYVSWVLGRRSDIPRFTWSAGATPRVLRRAGPLLMAGAVDTLVVCLGPIVLSA